MRSAITHFPHAASQSMTAGFWSDFYARRPAWLRGYISASEAEFLMQAIYAVRASEVVEIGTGSGFSTAAIAMALKFAADDGIIGRSFRVVSHDASPRFYGDATRRTGGAVYETLPSDLTQHVELRAPSISVAASKGFSEGSLRLLFIDANHKHPWPTLDLLAFIDVLCPGALVVLHDINLPLLFPKYPEWGAKFLFDGVEAERISPVGEALHNIGAIRIPASKDALRTRLMEVVSAHPWECEATPELDGVMSYLNVIRP